MEGILRFGPQCPDLANTLETIGEMQSRRKAVGHKKSGPKGPLYRKLRSENYFFISMNFLQSAFILSSALAASILPHFSVISAFSLSDMAPPWAAANAPKEAVAKAATTRLDNNFFIT
jgi:hypothetical protein